MRLLPRDLLRRCRSSSDDTAVSTRLAGQRNRTKREPKTSDRATEDEEVREQSALSRWEAVQRLQQVGSDRTDGQPSQAERHLRWYRLPNPYAQHLQVMSLPDQPDLAAQPANKARRPFFEEMMLLGYSSCSDVRSEPAVSVRGHRRQAPVQRLTEEKSYPVFHQSHYISIFL